MNTKNEFNGNAKLQATISVSPSRGKATPLFTQGTELPSDTTYMVSNEYKHPYREFHLFYGENEKKSDNVFLGQFHIEDIPLASEGGPPHISVKVSVNANQELNVSVLDPIPMKYRCVGFVNFFKHCATCNRAITAAIFMGY